MVKKVRIGKVSSNDSEPMIYIPKAIRKALGLNVGRYVALEVRSGRLIIKPLDFEVLKPPKNETEKIKEEAEING
ncbi:MAG: AbrB/MazE/SpoVT family DNA-binding domain-containing protein [Nitrososphaerota archaeon]